MVNFKQKTTLESDNKNKPREQCEEKYSNLN